MTPVEIRSLSIPEKFQLMEALWEDLRERFESLELSERHRVLLDQRRAAVEHGDSGLHEWDDVKASLGRA